MKEIVIISCAICEKLQKQPFMSILKSYPVRVRTNATDKYGGIVAVLVEAYLCGEHFVQMGGNPDMPPELQELEAEKL